MRRGLSDTMAQNPSAPLPADPTLDEIRAALAPLIAASAAFDGFGDAALADAAARDDMVDLRQLLGAWRDAKTSAWKAAVDWAVRCGLALLVVGLAMKLGLPGLLR